MPVSEVSTNPQVQRTHRVMLDAARELFHEQGPAAVTHLRVAETSGVARATVYRHWPDRVGILLDLLRRGVDLHLASPPAGERTAPEIRKCSERGEREDPGRDDRSGRMG